MFDELFMELAQQGVIDTAIPALLVFALVFAVLDQTRIISKNKSINSVLSLSFGLLFAYFGNQIHVKSGVSLVQLVNSSILDVTVIILAAIMLFVFVGSLGYKKVNLGGSKYGKWFFVLLSVGLIVFIFLYSAGYLPSSISLSQYRDQMSMLVPILIFGLVVWYVVHEPDPKNKGKAKDKTKGIVNDLGKIISSNKKKNNDDNS